MPNDYRSNAEILIEGAEHAARSHWRVLLLEGVALIVFGILVLLIAPLASLGIASAIGWTLLFGGAVAMIAYSRLYLAPRASYLLFSAMLGMVAGLALIVRPMSGAISLAVILIICLALGGVAKLTYPLERFRNLSNYRGWIRASGVIDLMAAAVMFTDLPQTALWAPGLLLGANMILGGVAMIVAALVERRKLPVPEAHPD